MLSQISHPGFEAWIERDDGTKFNEYQVVHTPAKDGQPAQTECWLESEDDAKFAIWTRKTSQMRREFRNDGWTTYKSVDGRDLSGGAWFQHKPSHAIRAAYTQDAATGKVTAGRLKFGQPITDDESEVTLKKTLFDKLGSIQITLEPGKFVKTTCGPLVTTERLGVVHEKAMKKLGRTTDFYSTNNGHLYYKFIFKYRPRAVLELLEIVKTRPLIASSAAVISVRPPALENKKRKRDERSETETTGDAEGPDPIDLSEEDVKPGDFARMAKRIKFLEEMTAKHRAGRNSRSGRKGPGLTDDQAIDLTSD